MVEGLGEVSYCGRTLTCFGHRYRKVWIAWSELSQDTSNDFFLMFLKVELMELTCRHGLVAGAT